MGNSATVVCSNACGLDIAVRASHHWRAPRRQVLRQLRPSWSEAREQMDGKRGEVHVQ